MVYATPLLTPLSTATAHPSRLPRPVPPLLKWKSKFGHGSNLASSSLILLIQVEALEFYGDRLTELRRQILEEQAVAKAADHVWPAAFVTFNNRASQVRQNFPHTP